MILIKILSNRPKPIMQFGSLMKSDLYDLCIATYLIDNALFTTISCNYNNIFNDELICFSN